MSNLKENTKRCAWVSKGDELYEKYHDEEWGIPVHDDRVIFEFLVLESAQAGLSWATVLRKRENYRRVFAKFDPKKISKFNKKDVSRLLKDRGIIRNRLKIEATISNAKIFIDIQKEFGSFDKYMWQFVGGKPITHNIKKLSNYPKFTPEAEAFAEDLKKRGFRFFGPTIAYAHMQALGMFNDHMVGCFRRLSA